LSASGTDDTSWIKESEEFKELVDRLWEKWKGMKITLDARKRPNKLAFTNFLARLVAAAYEAGVEDPLKTIDWEHVLDPGLSQAENTHIFEEQYHIRVTGRRRRSELPPMAEDREQLLREEIRSTEAMIRDLDFQIRYGEDIYGNKLTPEQVENAKRQKEELEAQLEELRRELEELERQKPPAPPPRERERGAPLPRRRRARPAEERAPAPQPAPPPAPAPPTPPPAPPAEEEEVERARLWELFALALTAAGLDPTQYEDEFESIYNAVRGRPYLEKFRAVMRHASAIIKENRPEVYVPTEAIARQVEEAVRRELESLAERLTPPAPPRPEEYRAAVEAELASVPPEESIVMLPVEDVKLTPEQCGGYDYIWAPNADALGEMRGFGVNEGIIEKFYTCPEMWWNEADGSTDLEFTVEVMKEAREVPPFFAEWLMRLAKAIDDRYEEEGRLKGITRLRDIRKSYKGPLTSAGRRM